MSAGVLYLVATPIGNLGDFTHRAVEVLKKVSWIACEDTRHSKTLLNHYSIDKPLISYFDHSEKRKAPELIGRILLGENGALISDAGTPGLADPGYRLVQEAINSHVRIESIPGPSALVAALVMSGLPTDRFIFDGFAPVKDGAKKKWLSSFKLEERTVIFYESPHRIAKTLEAINEVLGDIPVVVARELTKKFEEVVRGKASEVKQRFAAKKNLGEFVVLFSVKEK